MAMAMWAKSAAGTNLGFVRDFGRILKAWREILQSTLPRKQLPTKPNVQSLEVTRAEGKNKCLKFYIQPSVINRSSKSFGSRIFNSFFSRTTSRTLASELRRQAALRFSSTSSKNFRNMPIMSLIGVTLGVNLTSVMDDGSERMMSELRENFRSYTWQTEPLDKLPTCLDDLLINEKSIANGCEGAVYKAKVKAGAENPVVASTQSASNEDDNDYNLALKAVFNYGAESNANSILNELEREIVPLRPEGCQLETSLGKRVGQLPPHPNIVDMPGIFVDDMLVTEEGLKKFPAAMPHRLDPEHFYGHNKTLYLVMRRRSSHLHGFLARSEPITMETRCQILSQLLEGVSHLTQHGVAHRDVKADNILVDVTGNEDCPRVEICDFGCCLAEENKSLKVPYPTRDMYLGGNSWLMAPEISTAVPGPDSYLDFSKSDLWAVGAMAYEILGGGNPFYPCADNSRHQLSSRTYRQEDLPTLPADVPEAVEKLVKALLARDPSERPKASVAAAVMHMATSTMVSSVTASPQSRNPMDSVKEVQRQGRQACSKAGAVHKRHHQGLAINRLKHHTSARRPWPGSSFEPSLAVSWSMRDRKWLNWVLGQGFALLCQLTFADQSKPWKIESVMSFLFLSRLTYSDFKEAVCFF